MFANGSASGQDYFRLSGGGGGLDSGTNNSVGFGAGAGYLQTNVSAGKGTSDQNDYNGSAQTNLWIGISTDASRNITGFRVPAGGFGDRQIDGEVHIFSNVGSFNAVFKHQDAGSSAGNRFLFSAGADITLGPNQSLPIIYDGTTQRWRDV